MSMLLRHVAKTTIKVCGVLLLLPLVISAGKSETNPALKPSEESGHDIAWLPKSSLEFFISSSCGDKQAHFFSQHSSFDSDDAFVKWVLSGRHVTWTPGWEVEPVIHLGDKSTGDNRSSGQSKHVGSYARVFDLLNWARQRNVLPTQIQISDVCHKGMELGNATRYDRGDLPVTVPPKPNSYVPADQWANLWHTCRKQLLSDKRVSSILNRESSSSCIEIPGVLVANPTPPLKVNNPCHLEYRMVDGAHRICLRKYLLCLLNGELVELQEHLQEFEAITEEEKANANETVFSDHLEQDTSHNPLHNGLDEKGAEAALWDTSSIEKVYFQIEQKKRLINQTLYGFFLVLDQQTFQSFLMDSDPHATWAQSKHALMKGITNEIISEWNVWMGRVMSRVWERNFQFGHLGGVNKTKELLTDNEEL